MIGLLFIFRRGIRIPSSSRQGRAVPAEEQVRARINFSASSDISQRCICRGRTVFAARYLSPRGSLRLHLLVQLVPLVGLENKKGNVKTRKSPIGYSGLFVRGVSKFSPLSVSWSVGFSFSSATCVESGQFRLD